ncbi:hypothetical protein PQR75_00965 [Paraburkholderia fungorum]|uniref:hypothetical protein n=1 Tax=Paraburkholderia fungorum TaxID=134537 RepID=UPI0038B8BC43
MKQLTLKTGGKLEYSQWVSNEVSGAGAYVPSDVTEDAVAYVMEPVSIVGEIYVRDIFSLLDCNPLLLEMFKRAYAEEYLLETKKGNAEAYPGEYDPTGIEYLELFHDWEKDRETKELRGVHRLWIGGVGYELRDDVVEDGYLRYEKGTRIRWAIKFAPVGHIFNLPLRLNPEVTVADSQDITRTLHTFQLPTPTLAQVIHAVLWELSWAGNSQDMDEFVDMIQKAAENANMSEPVTAREFIRMLEEHDKAMNKLTSKIDATPEGPEDA